MGKIPEENKMEDANEIDFEKLEQENSETPLVEEQQINEEIISDVQSESVKIGSFGESYTYLKNPKPGEKLIITIKDVEKKPSRTLKRKSDGLEFQTGLLNKTTGKRTEFNLIGINNESLSLTSWSLVYAICGPKSLIEKKAKEKGSRKGLKIEIYHKYNGKDKDTSAEDLMKVRDLPDLASAQKYKAEVTLASKEYRIWEAKLVE